LLSGAGNKTPHEWGAKRSADHESTDDAAPTGFSSEKVFFYVMPLFSRLSHVIFMF